MSETSEATEPKVGDTILVECLIKEIIVDKKGKAFKVLPTFDESNGWAEMKIRPECVKEVRDGGRN